MVIEIEQTHHFGPSIWKSINIFIGIHYYTSMWFLVSKSIKFSVIMTWLACSLIANNLVLRGQIKK